MKTIPTGAFFTHPAAAELWSSDPAQHERSNAARHPTPDPEISTCQLQSEISRTFSCYDILWTAGLPSPKRLATSAPP